MNVARDYERRSLRRIVPPLSYIADRILVMNKGHIVDTGTFREIVDKAKDPYTQLLIEKKTAVMRRYEAVMKGGAASA